MEIYYLGHSSFRIKGKDATVVSDPYNQVKVPDFGLKFPKVEAQVVTVSHLHPDHNAPELVEGKPFVVSGPGEYEIKGVSIFGFPSFHDGKLGKERGVNTIYLIEMDGLRICHLGDLGEMLSDQKLEEIDGVDILMIPVGGFYTIGPKEASELVTKIEPLIVIPMHFRTDKTGSEFAKLSTVEDFLKESGVESALPLPKLVITKDKLPEERQVVLLDTKV